MTKKTAKPPAKVIGAAIVRECEALVEAGLATKTTYSDPFSLKLLLDGLPKMQAPGELSRPRPRMRCLYWARGLFRLGWVAEWKARRLFAMPLPKSSARMFAGTSKEA
jgi:hypothetical protein